VDSGDLAEVHLVEEVRAAAGEAWYGASVTRSILLTTFAFLSVGIVQSAQASTISVTAESIPSTSVPRGAQGVSILSLRMAASCEGSGSTLSSLTVRDTGVSASTDILGLYASVGGARATSVTSLNRQRQGVLRFQPLRFLPCERKTVTVLADVSPTADIGSRHSFRIHAGDIVSPDASISASFPLLGATSAVAGPSRTSVQAEVLPPSRSPRYAANQELARIRLTVRGNKPLTPVTLTLSNEGSAMDADLRNMRLTTNSGKDVSTVVSSMSGRQVTLSFLPTVSLDPSSVTMLSFRGDVRASRRRTIRFVIEEPSDLRTVEAVTRTRK